MAESLIFSEASLRLESHPLLPDGHLFSRDDVPAVTDWGDVLPPVDFCRQQFRLLGKIACQPRLTDEEAVPLLADYLARRLMFDPALGCWKLPLAYEYDDKKRACYPYVAIARLGYHKKLAHRASVEIFLGQSPNGHPVDHRCRCHACCNPYHLKIVTPAVNNERKIGAILRSIQPTLDQPHSHERLTYGNLLDALKAFWTNQAVRVKHC